MEIIFAFFILVVLTSLMAFSVWGSLFVTYLVTSYLIVIIKGIFQDKKISEAVNGDLEDKTKDILAFILSGFIVGMAIGIGDWTPVEFGMCIGAVIFYIQIWTQTGGAISLPLFRRKIFKTSKSDYELVDLGKRFGEMSEGERRKAVNKIADVMLKKAKNNYK